MYMVQSDDDNSALANLVATRKDQIALCGATRLVRGIVTALHFLDELVQHGQVLQEFGRHGCVVGEVMIDELL